MNILKAKVDWFEQFDNYPMYKILVEDDTTEFKFSRKGNLYFAESNGFCRFYAYSRPDEGFGGRKFEITMIDGSKKVLKGPWSSSASCVGQEGFTPCVDISYTSLSAKYYNPRNWSESLFHGSAITLDFAKLVAKMTDTYLVEVEPFYFIPSLDSNKPIKLYERFEKDGRKEFSILKNKCFSKQLSGEQSQFLNCI